MLFGAKVLQYAALVGPVNISAVAGSTPDISWLPTFPTHHMRAHSNALATMPYVPFGVIRPVPVMSWTGAFADRVDAVRRATQFHAHVVPVFVADGTVALPDLAWDAKYPSRLYRARGLGAAQQLDQVENPAYIPDTTVVAPLLSWASRYPVAINKRVLSVAEQQTLALPVLVPDVTAAVTQLSWKAQYPDRINRQVLITAAQQAAAWPAFVPDVTAPVALTSWRFVGPDAVARITDLGAGRQALAFWPFPITVSLVVPTQWPAVFADQVIRPRFAAAQQQTVAEPVLVPDTTEQVTPVSWRSIYPAGVDRLVFAAAAQLAYVAPLEVPDVTAPLTELAWQGVYPDYLYRIIDIGTASRQSFVLFPGLTKGPRAKIHLVGDYRHTVSVVGDYRPILYIVGSSNGS